MNERPPVDPLGLNVPRVESPFLETFLRGCDWTEQEQEHARAFARDGYLVVDLELDDFDALAETIDAELASKFPPDDRRVGEAWYFSDSVRRIATCPSLLRLLTKLYGRRAFPFQTLNFDAGTQQPAHSDTLHFHCHPQRFMCGVWVALEDVRPGTGELFVHPGSHRLPVLDMFDLGLPSSTEAYFQYEDLSEQMLAELGFARHPVVLKKGQCVIWAANLYHGGMPILEAGSTRKSQVTHYYFDDCTYYFPMSSDPHSGDLCVREVVDLERGAVVPHRLRGHEVPQEDFRTVMSYPRPLPDWVDGSLPERPASEPEDAEHLQRRLKLLEETAADLRGQNEEWKARVSTVEAQLHELWSSRAFKLVHGVQKTWRGLFGR